MFTDEKFVITGGTGSLGSALVRILAESAKVVVYSRSEERQFILRESLTDQAKANVEMIIGDLSDVENLSEAMSGCTHIIHTAAMKDLVMCENQPWEAVQVNVIGTQNLLRAARKSSSIRNICAISTDKAAKPTSSYGMTKYLMEKLVISSIRLFQGSVKVSVARFGNMYNSTGSLLSHWKKFPEKIPGISHPDLTRFFFSKEEAVNFTLSVVAEAQSGEIHIPKMKSARVIEIMKMFNHEAATRISGLQKGEKIHEDLLGPEEIPFTTMENDRYIVHANTHETIYPQRLAIETLSSSKSPHFSRDEIAQMLKNV